MFYNTYDGVSKRFYFRAEIVLLGTMIDSCRPINIGVKLYTNKVPTSKGVLSRSNQPIKWGKQVGKIVMTLGSNEIIWTNQKKHERYESAFRMSKTGSANAVAISI